MGAEKPDYSLHIKAQREAEAVELARVRKGALAQIVGKFINPLRPILEFIHNPIKFLMDFPMRYGRFREKEESVPKSAPPISRGIPSGGNSRQALQQLANSDVT